MTTVDIPAPLSGPTARLQLSDPATMLGIIATLGAVALKAVPALAHWHIDQLYPAVALLVAAIYDTVVVGKKHDLAGTLATIGPPLEALAVQAAPLLGVDPQIVADLKAELDSLKASVPSLAKGAVADLFTQAVAHPAAAVAQPVADLAAAATAPLAALGVNLTPPADPGSTGVAP